MATSTKSRKKSSASAGTGKFQTSIRFSEDARSILELLSESMRVSKTDVIELAIRNMARKEMPEKFASANS